MEAPGRNHGKLRNISKCDGNHLGESWQARGNKQVRWNATRRNHGKLGKSGKCDGNPSGSHGKIRKSSKFDGSPTGGVMAS